MGTASRLKFVASTAKRRRVLVALPSGKLASEIRRRLEEDGHSLVVTEERSTFEFALEVIGTGGGAAPHVIVVASAFAAREWIALLRRLSSTLGGTLVVVLNDRRDDDDLELVAEDGWIVMNTPISMDHLAFIVRHADLWRFLLPSRGFFERLGI